VAIQSGARGVDPPPKHLDTSKEVLLTLYLRSQRQPLVLYVRVFRTTPSYQTCCELMLL